MEKIPGIPAEVMAHIDAVLALLNNEKAVAHLEFVPARYLMLAGKPYVKNIKFSVVST